jgi:uncharacterized protein
MTQPTPSIDWRLLDRRDVLRSLGMTAAAPLLAFGGSRKRRVGIVGGGFAGVATAWLLDGACDVTLFEAEPRLGGNVRSVELDLDGHPVVVDMGAQYFHPGPYPHYTALLTSLGLFGASDVTDASHAFNATITVDAGEATPRFVSPWFPGRWWPLLAWWNWSGIITFAIAFAAAQAREARDESWALTLEDWLPTLGLSREQWEGMLLPWAASLAAGDIEEARGYSARAVMVFAAKALPPFPLDPVSYFVLRPGMGEVITRLIGQTTSVDVLTGARVQQVTRTGQGDFHLRCADGRSRKVDELVLAGSGPTSVKLLDQLPGFEAQAGLLRSVGFYPASLALHRDPLFAPADPNLRSFLNCHVHGPYCEASMAMEGVIADAPAASTSRLWKSWVTHRETLARPLFETSYTHVLPAASSMSALDQLRLLQGIGGVWIAGGYTRQFDSQETALQSAMAVASGLGVQSSRLTLFEGD